jgi:hypothetical protein
MSVAVALRDSGSLGIPIQGRRYREIERLGEFPGREIVLLSQWDIERTENKNENKMNGFDRIFSIAPMMDWTETFKGLDRRVSVLTAQVTAVARWQFDQRLSGFPGYRYLYVDYDSDNFIYNTRSTAVGP